MNFSFGSRSLAVVLMGSSAMSAAGVNASPAQASPAQPTRQRIGVMGGTFDPIHNGHLVAASEVADKFSLDSVIFVPTGQPWQKADKQVTPAEARYLMTVIATASNPRFGVSRVDIDRGGAVFHYRRRRHGEYRLLAQLGRHVRDGSIRCGDSSRL